MLHYFGILKPAAPKFTRPGQQKPLFGGDAAPLPENADWLLSRAERSALTLSADLPGDGPLVDDPLSERLAQGRFVSLMLPPYF